MTRGWVSGLAFLAAGVATGGQGILSAEHDGASNAIELGLVAEMQGPGPDDARPAKTIAQQFAAIPGREKGSLLISASLTPWPLASSVSMHVLEAPSPLERSISVTSLFPSPPKLRNRTP